MKKLYFNSTPNHQKPGNYKKAQGEYLGWEEEDVLWKKRWQIEQ